MKSIFLSLILASALSSSLSYGDEPASNMTIKQIQVGSGLAAAGILDLVGNEGSPIKALTLTCSFTGVSLKVTKDNDVITAYSIRDFYSYGCNGLIRTLVKLVAPDAEVQVRFWPNAFPGLLVVNSANNVGFTFVAGGNPAGKFVPVP